MKGKEVVESPMQLHPSSDFSAFAGYSGKDVSCAFTWIIDHGASSHMCHQGELFKKFHCANRKHSIHLPDGTIKTITQVGEVELNDIILQNVLFVLGFRYNLLSVGQLAKDNNIEITFSANCCCLHDKISKKVKAVAWLVDGLYLLDQTSFSASVIESIQTCKYVCNSINSTECQVDN